LQLNFNQFYFLQFVFLAVLSFVNFIFFSSFIFYRLPGKYSDLFPRQIHLLFCFWQFYFLPTNGEIFRLFFPTRRPCFLFLAVLLYSHRTASPLLIRRPSSLKNRLCQPNA
jgi:hypothetical protein